MSALVIREARSEDRETWLSLYRQVFAGQPDAGLLKEIDRIYADPAATAYLAFQEVTAVGFAEMALRPYANGCHSKPVPFLEGIWVDPAHRRKGFGAALIAHVEAAARAAGHRELGSDVELSNLDARTAHAAWGFAETEAVVFLRKEL